jgi:hypothetical protein
LRRVGPADQDVPPVRREANREWVLSGDASDDRTHRHGVLAVALDRGHPELMVDRAFALVPVATEDDPLAVG